MLIQFNGTWLTNDGSGTYPERAWTSACNVKLNGKQLIQEAQFLRGVSALPIARGNKINQLSFDVIRNFQLLNPSASNWIALTEAFALTHFSGLPTYGALVLTCGAPGETSIVVQAANAVLEAEPNLNAMGARLTMSYSFRCGLLTQLASSTLLQSQSGPTLESQTGQALQS